MTEIVGDIVQPSEFIVPRKLTLGLSGEIILSGGKLWFGNATGGSELITSA